MIDLVYLSYKPDLPADDYWDHAIIHDLVSGQMWGAVGSEESKRHEAGSLSDFTDGAVVVFPARNQVDYADKLNDEIKRLKWLVLILTGDEANEFPAHKISHPNMRLWIMGASPKVSPPEARRLGSGYSPIFGKVDGQPYIRKVNGADKPLDYFFAGQITHERRQQLAKELDTLEEFKHANHLEGERIYSKGFTQGLSQSEYADKMMRAKVVPCPSGAVSPDSFRLYEALESGCVPVVDAYSPSIKRDDYWTWHFGEEPPFPVYTDLDQARGYIIESAEQYPVLNNKVYAWWQAKKRQMAYDLWQDIESVGGKSPDRVPTLRDKITVIMPSSPIPDHPSTDMIYKTIQDVRVHLPDNEIIITVDGLRPEQEHYREAYDEYIRRLLWLCNNRLHNVLPVLFDEHTHQAGMARAALKLVKTPTILYVEHDTPLTPDRPIPFSSLVQSVQDGTANVIRFSHESKILDEHKHLIHGWAEEHHGALLTRTQQWSQRPHLASVAFYSLILDNYFHPKSKTMIEDVMHQVVEVDMRRGGYSAWYNWRIWLFTPHDDPDGSILRSYNLDGRKNDPKFPMEIVEDENE